MITNRHDWAVVLAAGDGTRLSALTRDAQGNAVPKQFCSLDGGSSLLHAAVQRARHFAPRSRVCVIVAASHRRHWQQALRSVDGANIIVQPRNCGTAHGVLLATLSVLGRDPLARIAYLPADHYVRDEAALAGGLRRTASLLARDAASLLLLGVAPDKPDPELGYIIPGERRSDGSHDVARFVEKPALELSRTLLAQGALWNSFIFAAHGATLVAMVRERLPAAVQAMSAALARDTRSGGGPALGELYRRLEVVDFSRAIVQGAEARLRVIAAPACGWTDLGTPGRVAETLHQSQAAPPRRARRGWSAPGIINLAAQHARLQLRA